MARGIREHGHFARQSGVYADKLTFGAPGHFPRHWKEELRRLETDLERLVAARPPESSERAPKPLSLVRPASEGTPPVAMLAHDGPAVVGRDFTVSARVTSASEITSVRLRYRHLTQYEDYQTAMMTFDPTTRSYTGRIPGDFVDPEWDLMYFVEVVDANGRGRMFPDLEKKTPYVIVSVQR